MTARLCRSSTTTRGNPYNLCWYLNRITEVTQTLRRDIGLIEQNPVQGLTQLVSDIGGLAADEFGHAIEFVQAFPEFSHFRSSRLSRLRAASAGLAGAGRDSARRTAIPADVAAADAPHLDSACRHRQPCRDRRPRCADAGAGVGASFYRRHRRHVGADIAGSSRGRVRLRPAVRGRAARHRHRFGDGQHRRRRRQEKSG